MNSLHWISAVFSPTGGTAALAKAITGGQGQVVDLSVPAPVTPVADNAVLLAAAPVFGGRIPAVALERLAALSGSGPAVAVAVYGNRDYEDALLELSDALKAGGFQVIGAAAFVAQHSIAPTIAQGRPDQADLEAAASFGRAVLDKLAGDQVDLFVNGLCVARGDVVVVDDNFGVRITEVLRQPGLLNLSANNPQKN